MNWKPGQKLVCVDEGPIIHHVGALKLIGLNSESPVIYGRTYTAGKSFINEYGLPSVWIEEVRAEKLSERFRPVEERKLRISEAVRESLPKEVSIEQGTDADVEEMKPETV